MILKKIGNWASSLKMRKKLLLIYCIGGLLPMLILEITLLSNSRKLLLDQAASAELNQLAMVKDELNVTMRIITDVSKRFYLDEKLEEIALTEYTDYERMVQDFRDYTGIDACLNSYYEEIESVRIYLNNDSIAGNSQLIRITDAIREQAWYRSAYEAQGHPVWAYVETESGKKQFTLYRLLRTEQGKEMGILSIAMRREALERVISKQHGPKYLILDDSTLVQETVTKEDSDLISIASACKEDVTTLDQVYNGQRSLLVVMRINNSYTSNPLTLMSISSYREFTASADEQLVYGFFIMGIGVCISFGLIFFFSHYLSARIIRFKEEMHRAAEGDFTILEPSGESESEPSNGSDEIGELYEDLHTMLKGIQNLIHTVYEERLLQEQLQRSQKEAQFQMLSSQINPHFLYNTLETIRMKALCVGQKEIADLVKMLAKILRSNIQAGTQTTIGAELEVVQCYLKIQQCRFGERIQFAMEVEEDIKQYPILTLLIQPIVENAFIHGLEGISRPGMIHILCKKEQNQILIRVTDNGIGIRKEKLEEIMLRMNGNIAEDAGHIGLANVHQRIKFQYGEMYGITIHSVVNQETCVEIKLPDFGAFG